MVREVMRSPRTVDVEITSRCNLRCRYCYYFDNPGGGYGDLPASEWLTFFEELGEAAVMDVCIAGGEPFTRRDLPELIDGIVRNRMRFTILSNGTLVDNAAARMIASTGRCDQVQVSIDGSGPESHDAFRGAGSFEAAVRGLRALRRRGVPVTVRLTIHRRNVDDLEAAARFFLEELGLEGFSTNAAGYLGSCRLNTGEVLLSTRERQRAMETLLRLAEKYPGRIQAAAGPLAEGKMWLEMEEARTGGEAPSFGGGKLTGCGCPAEKIAVRSDGVIVPCTMLAHMELGGINRDSLLDIWQRSPELNVLRERCEVSLDAFEECAGCGYRAWCTGNCPALAHSLTGEVNRPSPDACLRRYLEDGGKLPDRERIRTSPFGKGGSRGI
jgi:SynChlorMet cassette radical SAM/SPASM protein ScmE